MKSTATGVRENGSSPDSRNANAVTLQPGQPFNPYRLFHGIFIPEALVRYKDLTPGAKIAYGRLVRYAGQDGSCHPRQETLAREIGVSDRQVRTYLQELICHRFLKVIRKGLRAPNEYVFLWHAVFNGADRKETSGPISRESSEESPFKESHSSSSSGGKMKTPPPTPSSTGRKTQTDGSSTKKADDDARVSEPEAEYESELEELIALIEKATGQRPDAKLISDILDRLKLRDMPLRAYLDDVRPRLQRLKRRPGPGFFYSMASEPARSSAATSEPRPKTPKRCAHCSGTGKTPDGWYCSDCPMGRDLERVEKRSAREKAKTGAAA